MGDWEEERKEERSKELAEGREEEEEEEKSRPSFEATNASGRSRTLSCVLYSVSSTLQPCERNAGPLYTILMCDRYPLRSYTLRRQLDEPLAQRGVIGRPVLSLADPAVLSLQKSRKGFEGRRSSDRTVQTDKAEQCIRQAATPSTNKSRFNVYNSIS
ncbi:uncharacterized protein An02g13780 [Aspergillus niger]|uniref:Contig An02c0450, genomic contig n=2 Tax=Aspergillus niger TaxID=5061 RepID=A2QF98_ASPNC|nr:uncharacterized protein An02g13780 [Aspergillus niger]CAK37962.1 unnamed protein product [Aspergillus niger]